MNPNRQSTHFIRSTGIDCCIKTWVVVKVKVVCVTTVSLASSHFVVEFQVARFLVQIALVSLVMPSKEFTSIDEDTYVLAVVLVPDTLIFDNLFSVHFDIITSNTLGECIGKSSVVNYVLDIWPKPRETTHNA